MDEDEHTADVPGRIRSGPRKSIQILCGLPGGERCPAGLEPRDRIDGIPHPRQFTRRARGTQPDNTEKRPLGKMEAPRSTIRDGVRATTWTVRGFELPRALARAHASTATWIFRTARWRPRGPEGLLYPRVREGPMKPSQTRTPQRARGDGETSTTSTIEPEQC